MATAIQVTGTGFDSNVWGLIPDNDGTTCWAFNDTSISSTNKYARFSLVDGSIIHVGNTFAGVGSFRSRTDAAVFWAQGDNGKYYVIANGSPNLYQFEILTSAGGSTSPLDTYSTTLNSMSVSTPFSMTAFTSGGVHYLALMTSTLTIINTDTWTVVGTLASNPGFGQAAFAGGQIAFMDKFGDVWALCMTFDHRVAFLKWHPADGASAGVLNGTVTYVAFSTLGATFGPSNEPWFPHYVSTNHSVLLSSEFGATNANFTGDLYNIDLVTLTPNVSFSSDGSRFLSTFNYAYDSSDMEMQNPSQTSGKLAIQSDTSGPEFNTQVGGIFNLLDPVALTIGTPTDITQLILGTALPAPTQGSYTGHGTGPNWYNQFADLVYSETTNSLAVTYAGTDFSTGSALYLISFGAPPPPGVPFTAIPGGLFGF